MPCPLSAEIGLHPRFFTGQHVFNRPFDKNLPVAKYGDSITDREKTVEIVGDHVNRQTHGIAELGDELVEFGRLNRI